jgi:hypothetical protein
MEEWGWEALGDDDNQEQSHTQIHSYEHSNERHNHSFPKSNSERSLHSHHSYSKRSNSSLKGITSSPSFQELEKAIGATLASNFGNVEESSEHKTLSPSSSFLASRLSSTNLTQQKLMQQRLRQFHSQRTASSHYFRPHIPLSAIPAKVELSPFVNEAESRALILFHSTSVPASVLRETCSKFGVLYYIRPEFHNKGVTFISYFDLQAAITAKDSIPGAFGAESEVSAHFSITLHATNSNTEEFKIVVKNLPPNEESEAEVQSIFSRYGQLRSIQKTFGSNLDLTADSKASSVAYNIEYFNIQDARLAVSELSNTSVTIWGPDAVVKFAPLDERKQQLCRQLLAILSRWRTEIAAGSISSHQSPLPIPVHPTMNMPPYPLLMHMPPYTQPSTGLFSVPSTYDVALLPGHPLVPNVYQPPGFTQAHQPYIRPNYLPFVPYQNGGYPVHFQHYVDSSAPNIVFPTDQSNSEIIGESNLYVQEQNPPAEFSGNLILILFISPHFTVGLHNDGGQLNHSQRLAKKPKPAGDFAYSLDVEKLVNGSEKRTTIMVMSGFLLFVIFLSFFFLRCETFQTSTRSKCS